MEFLIIAALIILNGLFSMSEIALVSSRKFKLESKAKKGDKNAAKALSLANNPNTFLSTVQIGITLIGILTGIFSGQSLTTNLTTFFQKITFLAPYANSIAVVTIVIAITYLTIVFGELIPKRLGLSAPEKISSAVASPMTILSKLTKPLIWLLTKTNDAVLRLFGIKEQQDGIVTEEEIKAIIQHSTTGGEIQEIEQEIVSRVFALGDRKASELMTHRNDIVWVDLEDNITEIQAKVNHDPHSVYPVCAKHIDNIVGLVSLKDLFQKGAQIKEFLVSKSLGKPVFVSENMAAYRILEQFKASNVHSALVVDEYGSLQGIITMDDVMDELIGDSANGANEYQIFARNASSWLVDGQFPYFELVDYFDLPAQEEVGAFATAGGLFISLTNHIPTTGEKVSWGDFELEVVDMDGHRIDKIMITKK